MTETKEHATASISSEIARSVGTIWERRGGVRAASIDTQIEGDSIRCTIEDGEPNADDAAETAELAGTDSNAYKHEASAAVSRITKRTVSAYIAKRDKKTGIATQTFILERVRTKF